MIHNITHIFSDLLSHSYVNSPYAIIWRNFNALPLNFFLISSKSLQISNWNWSLFTVFPAFRSREVEIIRRCSDEKFCCTTRDSLFIWMESPTTPKFHTHCCSNSRISLDFLSILISHVPYTFTRNFEPLNDRFRCANFLFPLLYFFFTKKPTSHSTLEADKAKWLSQWKNIIARFQLTASERGHVHENKVVMVEAPLKLKF